MRYIKTFENKSRGKTYTLYHGTQYDFDSFSLTHFGLSDSGWLGRGIYMTNDKEYAEGYAKDGYLLTCEVTVKNPLILTDYLYSQRPLKLLNEYDAANSTNLTDILVNEGYDSVILTYEDEDIHMRKFIELCVFEPRKIKIIKKEIY